MGKLAWLLAPMFRVRMGRAFGSFAGCLTVCLVGCTGASQTGPHGGCETSADCAVGYLCGSDAVCVSVVGCTPGACPAGQFCDDDLACKDVTEQCVNLAGCACTILGDGGTLMTTGAPVITLAPNAAHNVEVVLRHVGGGTIPGALFGLSVDDTSLFSTAQAKVTALPSATRGTTALHALVQGRAACDATLVNLGDPPAGGNVRVFVADARTGQPLAGVEIHLDYDGDGDHDGSVAPLLSGAEGLVVSTTPPTGAYSVSAFLRDYTYLSVVGIDSTDIVLPLSPRPEPKVTAGFSGRLDFSAYEDRVLGGTPGSLRFGIVGASFPVEALLNFDLEPFLGPPPTGACTDIPAPLDCYDINIPGLAVPKARLPLGVVLGVATGDIKGHFDVATTPGHRLAWVLGGEIEVEQISDFIALISDQLNCATDCPFSFGRAIDTIIPLMSRFALGTYSDLSLDSAPLVTWHDHITQPYASRPATSLFPRLDDGELGRLSPTEPLHSFVDYAVPDLPSDPATGVAMEGLIIMTGVEVAGLGVVPLGVSTGVDCTVGDCLDRIGNAGAFDGVVNGGQVCVTNAGPNEIPCPTGVPATVANGHVGLFYAQPTGPLMHQRPITVLVALPISSAMIPDTNIRATTLLYWQAPDQIDAALAAFPIAPLPPAQLGNRTYTLAAISSDIDIDFVTLQGLPDPTLFRQRWMVYLAAGVGTFTAPAVPAGMADPLAEPDLRIAHVGFVTQAGTTLDTLVRNDDTTLAELAHQTIGITFEQRDVPNP